MTSTDPNAEEWLRFGRASDGTHIHLGHAWMRAGAVLCGYHKHHQVDEIPALALVGKLMPPPAADLPLCGDCVAIALGTVRGLRP